MYTGLKHLHMLCAVLSVTGFLLRAYWAFVDHRLLQSKLVKVLPHVIDTVLLASAIGMLVQLHQSPTALPWVMVKIVALVLYIVLGLAVLKWSKNNTQRLIYFVCTLGVIAYIFTVAFTKNPMVI